jgi:hypothetical protein
MLRPPKSWRFMPCSWYLQKALHECNLVWDCLELHTMLLVSSESSWWMHWLGLRLWSYGVEAFDYWTIFSMKTKQNRNWKLYWNLGVLVLLGSPRRVKFNRVYFTIVRAKLCKILILEWILLLEIQENLKNWVWKEKSVELSMCSHCQI